MKQFFLSLFLILTLFGVLFCNRLKNSPKPAGIPVDATFSRRQGLWDHTSKDGIFTQYFANGIIHVRGRIVNGKRDGFWKTYGMKGKILTTTGMYKNGKKDGIWKYYDTRGRLYQKIEYKPEPIRLQYYMISPDYGNENGPYARYYPDGRLEERGLYIGGYVEDRVVRYYRNGNAAMKGQYKKELKTGRWLYFYPEGGLEREEYYKKDLLHGIMKNFHQDGSVYHISRYKNGKQISVKIVNAK